MPRLPERHRGRVRAPRITETDLNRRGRTNAGDPGDLLPVATRAVLSLRRRATLQDRLEVREVREASAPYPQAPLGDPFERYDADSVAFFAPPSGALREREPRAYIPAAGGRAPRRPELPSCSPPWRRRRICSRLGTEAPPTAPERSGLDVVEALDRGGVAGTGSDSRVSRSLGDHRAAVSRRRPEARSAMAATSRVARSRRSVISSWIGSRLQSPRSITCPRANAVRAGEDPDPAAARRAPLEAGSRVRAGEGGR